MESQRVFKKITVNLYEDDYTAIEKEAVSIDRDPSWIIREAVREHVKKSKE